MFFANYGNEDMNMDLPAKLKEMVGLSSPVMILGKGFSFKSGEDKIYGTITGVRTSDDGMPVIEVSNTYFAGLNITKIMFTSNASEIGDLGALLFTTSKEQPYHEISGVFHLFM